MTVTRAPAEPAWRRWLPRAWSLALALLLLGPALGPGYVLSHDMVWVPDLAMRGDFWGLGTGLPRAVPSDAVVALLDEVVPGMLLQKFMLVAALAGAGWGAALLVPYSLAARLVAVSVYVWNPFVTERLLIGHWPVLVGYALLPWVALAARRWRDEGAFPVALLVLVPVGSLSASAGVATAVTLMAFGWSRSRSRPRALASSCLVLAANAPWLAAGLLHAPAATTDPAGAGVFALSGTDALPAPLAALGLGGIWNSEVVLPSSGGVLGWAWLAFVTGLAALGVRAWWGGTARRDTTGYLVCWGIGYGLAVLTWVAPGAMQALVSQVPGGGLLRDGARALALCAPLVAVLAAFGAEVVTRWVPSGGGLARTVAGALVLLPITVMPDALLGLSGRLEPAHYPGAYDDARAAVTEDRGDGDVLALPLTSYRQPDWNHGRKVLDPVGRYLVPDYVASDDLVVSGTDVGGEDPRVRQVIEDLAEDSPHDRAERLAGHGIGFVVVDRTAPGTSPGVAGRRLLSTDELTVVALDAPRPRAAPVGWVVVMVVAWTAFAGLLLLGAVANVRAGWRRARNR